MSTISLKGSELLPDETEALLERQKSSSQRVAEWGRVSALGKDNESSLAEEMESTLREVTRLVEDLETAHKARVFRRNHEGISSLEKYRSREKEFQESVEIGLGIMKKITDAVGVKLAEGDAQKGKPGKIELHATDSVTQAGDRIKKCSHNLVGVMTRFARVLEAEGVPHELPVPQPPPPRPARNVERRRFTLTTSPPQLKWSKPYTRASVQTSAGSSSIADYDAATPVAFLREYAEREDLILNFTEVKVTKTLWYTEYTYNCKLHSFSANGRGKKKLLAKQLAANQVLKIFVNKQRKGKLPQEIKPLMDDELNLALHIICENEDFEAQLEAACSQENVRPPIYTPVINTQGTVVRCKAFGLNIIGRGRTKEIAKRMAAKTVLETIHRRK